MSCSGRLIFFFRLFFFASGLQASVIFCSSGQVTVPSVKSIRIGYDSVIVLNDGALPAGKFTNRGLLLEHRNNNIAFKLLPAEGYDYKFFLKGFDTKWTQWQSNNLKEYTNLPAGKYVLKSRYMAANNNTGEIADFEFSVLPRWFLSKSAIFVFFLLAGIIIKLIYDQLTLKFAYSQYSLEQIINKRTEDLIIEKEKTEALLANVLPKNTADELMAKGKATKTKYNFVTVLFSDIQGFTQIAEEMNPEILIDELDRFFFYFDSVVEKFRIEKIKTIGDAYMCAGGIPEKNRTNPVEVVLAAIEMMAYMNRIKETAGIEGMKYWDIRIGIHTGTVVAGVVGQKKLSYDIWGDTVNTASRMESSGDGGKINISGTTYEFVKEFFTCEYRGKMPVKYKGELEMYFVEGIAPDLRNEDGGPNRKFILRMQRIKLQDIEDMVTKLFDDEAPPNLYFHNSALVKSISNQVEILSAAERLADEEFIDLKLASVFLLAGYIYDYDKHMEGSCRLVEEILPVYGFDRENVIAVIRNIRNLFCGKPETLSDNILHDATYDYLGRVDFTILTDKLLRESTEYGSHRDRTSWIDDQIKLLNEHDFITQSARLMRSVSLEEQIAAIKVYKD
jgi:adenylate cyclase